MSHVQVYGFIVVMWALMILGGGIATIMLGSIHIENSDEFTLLLLSMVKAIASISLVIVWVYILNKIKQKIFTVANHKS